MKKLDYLILLATAGNPSNHWDGDDLLDTRDYMPYCDYSTVFWKKQMMATIFKDRNLINPNIDCNGRDVPSLCKKCNKLTHISSPVCKHIIKKYFNEDINNFVKMLKKDGRRTKNNKRVR